MLPRGGLVDPWCGPPAGDRLPSSDPGGRAALPAAAVGDADLLARFAAVSDGRSEQARDHPVGVVLTLCAAAVLAGMRSFTAIAGWVADVPAEVLARLYARPATCPSKTTLWRVVTGADAAAVGLLVDQQAGRRGGRGGEGLVHLVRAPGLQDAGGVLADFDSGGGVAEDRFVALAVGEQ